MEKFIKENWFRLGILSAILILVLSMAYYFIVYIPQRNKEAKKQDQWIDSQRQLFEKSEKCPKLAQDYVKILNTPNYYNISYTYLATHYNQKLNTCLVDYTSTMITPVSGGKDMITFNEIIDNIFTNQTLIRSYYINNKIAGGPSEEEFKTRKEQLLSE